MAAVYFRTGRARTLVHSRQRALFIDKNDQFVEKRGGFRHPHDRFFAEPIR